MWKVVCELRCEECGLLYEEVRPYTFVNEAVRRFQEHRLRCWKPVSITQYTTSDVADDTTERSGNLTWHLQPQQVTKQPHHNHLTEDDD
jgi:hypothetical protein